MRRTASDTTSKHRHAVVFDLEFTAWEGSIASQWTRPGELTEIVHIGAVKLDAVTLQEVDSLDLLVRPRVNPVLSDYFVALTGITNDNLAARGLDFVTAYGEFLAFIGPDVAWAHGRDDLIIVSNLELYGWKGVLPLPVYANSIEWFTAQGIDLKGKRACHVAEAAGAHFEGQMHNALADARGVAAGFRAMIAKGAPNPFPGE